MMESPANYRITNYQITKSPRFPSLRRIVTRIEPVLAAGAIDQRGHLVDAPLPFAIGELARELLTARPEPASGRRIGGVGQVAVEHDPVTLPLLVGIRQRNR
jgi:hypothetical protein